MGYRMEQIYQTFPLAMAGEGERVKIISITGGRKMQKRLLSMGIQVNDIVQVVQRQQKGAVLISRENDRYGLGGGMAFKIMVAKV